MSDPNAQPVQPNQGVGVRHPTACIFHAFFKIASVFYYFTCTWVFQVHNFIINFVVLLLLVSADFWITKNVTGRFLVGLRWWNDVSDEGDGWRFETLEEGQRTVSSTDKTVFWVAQVVYVVVWLVAPVLLIFNLSKWPYLLIIVIAIFMGGSNLYGYFRCSREAKEALRKSRDAVTQAAVSSIATAATSSMFERAQGRQH